MPTSVQDVPFQISVSFFPSLGGSPPTHKAAVLVPNETKDCLAVFKSAISVQLEASQDSTIPTVPGPADPPIASPALVVPHQSKSLRAVVKLAPSVQFVPS